MLGLPLFLFSGCVQSGSGLVMSPFCCAQTSSSAFWSLWWCPPGLFFFRWPCLVSSAAVLLRKWFWGICVPRTWVFSLWLLIPSGVQHRTEGSSQHCCWRSSLNYWWISAWISQGLRMVKLCLGKWPGWPSVGLLLFLIFTLCGGGSHSVFACMCLNARDVRQVSMACSSPGV